MHNSSTLRACALPLLVLASTPTALADVIEVQLAGSYVEAIRSAGVWVAKSDLRPGVSNGEVLMGPKAATIRAADSRNLDSYFAREATPGAWDIDFGADWAPGDGPAADFFLFETGGNDDVFVRPRLANGTLGATTQVTGWSDTTALVAGGPNAGQPVFGLGFHFESLRQSNGAPLGPNDQIIGVRIASSSIDGASFLVRDPGASGGQDGDGSHSLAPAAPRALAPIELTFEGPFASETDLSPNPFLDYRLTVTFRGPGEHSITVPGFFDADGAKGDAGNLWKVRFLAPVSGFWTAETSMRAGPEVAVELDPNAGAPVPSMDGRLIAFQVGGPRSDERGFYRLGTLRDVGASYRKFDQGPHYLKAGTNSPENFLAIRALDDIVKWDGVGNLHSYEPHRADWRDGDPVLAPGDVTDDGKGVIGALNYLEEAGVNSLFMMVMNLGGDGWDVFPFIGPRRRPFEKTHYDTSRLRQWNTIFEHAQRRSISLSLVLNETELANELWLDEGQLGVERKLFYRELVARFGHHPAIRWNLCEENDFTVQELGEFAAYISALDGDEHAIAVHNNPNDLVLFQQLASNLDIDAASLQFYADNADAHVEAVRGFAQQAGRNWVVDADEMGPWLVGLTASNAVDTRKRILYDALLSGGGTEFYFGWHELPLGGDLTVEDFRTRSEMWEYMTTARTFMEAHLPFWEMVPNDSLVRNENSAFGGAEVFALPGEIYAIYYPDASSTGEFNLVNHALTFEQTWFNPRTGEFEGNALALNGGAWRGLGSPPSQPSEDWVVLVRRSPILVADLEQGSASAGDTQTLAVRFGPSFAGRDYLLISSLTGTSDPFSLGGLTIPVSFDRWSRFCLADASETVFENRLGALDDQGRRTIRVRLSPQFTGALVGATMSHCVVITQPYEFASNVVELSILP